MPDITTAVVVAIDIVKKLIELAKKVKDAETKNLIADLDNALADLKFEIAELKHENVRLQAELDKHAEAHDYRRNLEVRDGVLYFKEAPSGRAQGPYCPNCMEVRKQLVQIKDNRGTGFEGIGKFDCSACNSVF